MLFLFKLHQVIVNLLYLYFFKIMFYQCMKLLNVMFNYYVRNELKHLLTNQLKLLSYLDLLIFEYPYNFLKV